MENKIIAQIEEKLLIELPEVYTRYLIESESNQKYLYKLNEIIERNTSDEVTKYAPGYVIIGSDYGDQRFLMKSGREERNVFLSDVGDLNPFNFLLFDSDFIHCVNNRFEIIDSTDLTKKCDLILKCYPEGGLHDLILLKKRLRLSMSAQQLLLCAKTAPSTIIRDINCGLANSYLANAKELSKYLVCKFI